MRPDAAIIPGEAKYLKGKFDFSFCSLGIFDRDLKCFLQVTFLKNGTKSLPKLTSENLKNKWLEEGCLSGVDFLNSQGSLG